MKSSQSAASRLSATTAAWTVLTAFIAAPPNNPVNCRVPRAASPIRGICRVKLSRLSAAKVDSEPKLMSWRAAFSSACEATAQGNMRAVPSTITPCSAWKRL